MASSSAQPWLKLPINLYWIRKNPTSQISCMQAIKFISPLRPCVDDKATALPLPPRLQHCLRYSFKEVLIALKMVFLVLTALKNVAKQDYHLLKQKSVSQPLLLSFCYPVCYACHNKLSDCHNKWHKFRMLFCLAFVWSTLKHILVEEYN